MTVECQLDTSKQKTVTFKFDRDDMVPTDIANNLVRISRHLFTLGAFYLTFAMLAASFHPCLIFENNKDEMR